MNRAVALALPPLCFALAAAVPAPGKGATITVTVTDLRNAKGIVRACMTADEARFPRCRGVAGAHGATAEAREGNVSFTFKDVTPGRYAIALLHDENSNGKADRALGMMPKEGFGFSRDAKVRMGPPSFSDAVIDIGKDDRQLTIRMRYML
ncbi:DUF2141 domain-containing protein [Qipengyuania qiaonensis]|uniref:DUF2141 domain-containing protein n=1 Tax=Qipengyuania qiaonensis TaxID=2867240 RepID=A0ABS7J4G9_9SPHN|nr:DUF2141 domain-containing protein [Qipengyuania qiaonensis]MBX7482166.1 DUF2141 domain-containing protein [Qipengyuania qiaonensis]